MIGGLITVHCFVACGVAFLTYTAYAVTVAPLMRYGVTWERYIDQLHGIAIGIFVVWILWVSP